MKDFTNLKEGSVILNPDTMQLLLIDEVNGELTGVNADGYFTLNELDPKDWSVI